MNRFSALYHRKPGLWHWQAFLLICYIPIFMNLDALPLRIWDETRLAFVSKEMADHGHWFVPYFEGTPDMWNVKPPLMNILQALSIKLLGWNELAVRLPSALAALGTCAMLFSLFTSYFKRPALGLAAVAILLSFRGYVKDHAIRTGDYDSPLTMCIFGAGLSLFLFLESWKAKWIYLFFLALALGALTKGVAALLVGPGFLLYIFLSGNAKRFFSNRHSWLASLVLILTVLSYYLYREAVTPGYWAKVQEIELGGRFSGAFDGHSQPAHFYAESFMTNDLGFFFWLILPSLLICLYQKDSRWRVAGLLAFSAFAGHLLVISAAGTKLGWYAMPEYPFIAMLLAVAFGWLLFVLKGVGAEKIGLKRNILPALLVLVFLLPSYVNNNRRIAKGEELAHEKEYYYISHFLKSRVDNPKPLDGLVLLYEGYAWHTIFYVRRMQANGGTVRYSEHTEVKAGDKVIVSQDYIKQELLKKFDLQRFEVEGPVEYFELKPKSGPLGKVSL